MCVHFKRNLPPPSALRALLTRHKWFEVSGHRGQGRGHVEKRDQTLQWCWGQRGAGSSPGPSPAHYEGLDGQQNIKSGVQPIKKAVHVNCVRIQLTCDVDLACQSHVSLAHGTEQSAVVDQPSDTIIYNQFSEKFVVQHISVNKWAWREKTGRPVKRKLVLSFECKLCLKESKPRFLRTTAVNMRRRLLDV